MKPVADLHVHSIASGHSFSTVDELMRAAKKKGLKYLALTDHGPKMLGGPHEYYFFNLKVLPEIMHGVRILKGIEANIVTPDGGLDLDDQYLKRLDVVIASAHDLVSPGKLSPAANTKMMIGAMQNKYVDIVGHLENPQFPVNIREVIGAAKEMGKILEINNASFTVARKGSRDTCIEIIRELKAQNMQVVINSDAHIACLVGEVSAAWDAARENGITKDMVINFSKERMEEFLNNRKTN